MCVVVSPAGRNVWRYGYSIVAIPRIYGYASRTNEVRGIRRGLRASRRSGSERSHLHCGESRVPRVEQPAGGDAIVVPRAISQVRSGERREGDVAAACAGAAASDACVNVVEARVALQRPVALLAELTVAL